MKIKDFIKKLKEFNQDLEVHIKIDGSVDRIDEDTDFEIYENKSIYIGQN